VFSSGDLDPNTDLRDDHSWAVKAGLVPRDPHLFNFQGKNMILGHKGTERSVSISVNRDFVPLSIVRPSTIVSPVFARAGNFRVARESLSPLKTLGQNYPVPIPSMPGVYHVDVRVNFRHLEPTLFDQSGIPHLKHLLEIVPIAEHCSTFMVGPMIEKMPLESQPNLQLYGPAAP
jgi:hypothetical protein